MSKKPFFYRVDASKFLAEVVSVPESERSEWILSLAVAMVRVDEGHSDYMGELIKETTDFIEKKKHAAHVRWNKEKMQKGAVHVQDDALHMHSNARSSNRSSNSKEQSPYNPPKGDDLFDLFWCEYPKKVGKDAARKSWKKIKPSQKKTEEIIDALKWQKNSPQWTRDNGQFIPNPSTYLNQGRWQDEPEKSADEHRPANAQPWY